ncbi:MAG: hemolysin family protein [Spirochaetaceae bacterium]|jgi:CBS domain containing-hemolysin-like protein|nr:hemolysin family protein [Spirochaetaceae bacterium]
MDSFSIGILTALFFLLLCSAFFSASETAFSSLNRIKLKNMSAQGNKRAARALKLAENYDTFLSTVLIGNNIVNITSSALATVFFVQILGSAGVSVATLAMTILVLIVGEISPKTLAKEAPEQMAMFAAPLINALMFALTPINRLLILWKRCIVKLFKVQGNRSVTEEELLTFVKEVRQEGGINEGEETMIRRTIEFDDLTAQDIYTPRIDVAAVSLSDSAQTVDDEFHNTGYSRLPVYQNSIDRIIGVILLKDFHHQVIRRQQPLETVIKPAIFITKSMKLPKLLKTLQEKQAHLAVLVDEFGGTMGIVTIEDILEELVGEIWDEHDEIVERIIKQSAKTYTVLGNTDLDEFFRFFSLKAEDGKTDYPRRKTVGNWTLERFGQVPKEGDQFQFQHLIIKPSKIQRHRVMEVTVTVEERSFIEKLENIEKVENIF